MWRDFSFCLIFPVQIVTHMWREKDFFCITLDQFFSNFGHLMDPFHPVFYLHFKNIKVFKLWPKFTFLAMLFSGNYFLWGKIPSLLENSSRILNRLLEDFWSHLLLWGTIWEDFCSQYDSHCEKIVRRIWVETNTLFVFYDSHCELECEPQK